MDFVFSGKKIIFNRVLSDLDKFVIDFTRVLDKNNIRYVIVSGYVSIVFGRSRYTEDVDIIVEQMEYEKFEDLWDDLEKEFECMNTDDPKHAYQAFLKEYAAIRFFRKGFPFPNTEFKLAFKEHDLESLNNSIELILSENRIIISPLEMHIAFKMHLGSEKDFRDAKHVYDVFKEHIDRKKLKLLLKQFYNINDSKVKEYLSGLYDV